MSSRSNVRSSRLVSGAGARSSYQKQRMMVRRRDPRTVPTLRPSQADWAAAASSYSKLYRAELKGVDTELIIAAVPSTVVTNDAIICVNLASSGSGKWQRIGDTIEMKSLRIKGEAHCDIGPGPDGERVGNILRMVIVYDTQSNGASLPTFDTIFGMTAQSGTYSSYPLSQPSYKNMTRFRVLKDCTYIANPSSTPTGGDPYERVEIAIDEYISLKGYSTKYLSDNSPMSIADVSHGAIYVCFRCTNPASTFTTTDTTSARIRYTDV